MLGLPNDDPPTAETVNGLGNRKNDLVLRRIHDQGVEAYPGSVRYVQAAALREHGADVVVTDLADLLDGS